MANEAVVIELINGGCPVSFTCADGATIVKGTLLKVTDPRTGAAHSGAGQGFAGIAACDKLSGDGSTRITAWTNGIFDITATDNAGGGATSVGGAVMLSATANKTKVANGAGILISKVGYAVEAVSDDEVFACRVLTGAGF